MIIIVMWISDLPCSSLLSSIRVLNPYDQSYCMIGDQWMHQPVDIDQYSFDVVVRLRGLHTPANCLSVRAFWYSCGMACRGLALAHGTMWWSDYKVCTHQQIVCWCVHFGMVVEWLVGAWPLRMVPWLRLLCLCSFLVLVKHELIEAMCTNMFSYPN